jgi:hypothetical protein
MEESFDAPFVCGSKLEEVNMGYQFDKPFVCGPSVRKVVCGFTFSSRFICGPNLENVSFGDWYDLPFAGGPKCITVSFGRDFKCHLTPWPALRTVSFPNTYTHTIANFMRSELGGRIVWYRTQADLLTYVKFSRPPNMIDTYFNINDSIRSYQQPASAITLGLSPWHRDFVDYLQSDSISNMLSSSPVERIPFRYTRKTRRRK